MGKKKNRDLKELAKKIGEVVEPVCQAENLEFVHAECVSAGSSMIVRLYMDKPGGITLGDLTDMSRQLGDILDVHFNNLGSYRLEVSSPGLD